MHSGTQSVAQKVRLLLDSNGPIYRQSRKLTTLICALLLPSFALQHCCAIFHLTINIELSVTSGIIQMMSVGCSGSMVGALHKHKTGHHMSAMLEESRLMQVVFRRKKAI